MMSIMNKMTNICIAGEFVTFQILQTEPKAQKTSTTDIKTSKGDFCISFTLLIHTPIEGNYKTGNAIILLDAFRRFMVHQCKLVATKGQIRVDLKFTL